MITILPGFVDLLISAQLKKGILWARVEAVAKDIAQSLQSRSGVHYTPWFRNWIMMAMRYVPERTFARAGI